jgi:hypothetical protein
MRNDLEINPSGAMKERVLHCSRPQMIFDKHVATRGCLPSSRNEAKHPIAKLRIYGVFCLHSRMKSASKG